MKGDDLSERFLEFACRILKLAETLPRTLAGRHIAGQIIRAGTSPGANYEEARGGESPADFSHKLGVCLKELRETHYWLRVIERAQLVKPNRMGKIVQEADELCRIVAKSIQTARGRVSRQKTARSRQDLSQ